MERTLCRLAVALLLVSAYVAGCTWFARKEVTDPSDLLRTALQNTFSLRQVKVVDETAFPSSPSLISAKEARSLGTGVWTRIIEFSAPDRVHYTSSTEDGGIEAYRVGASVVYRLIGMEMPADDDSALWIRVADLRDVEDEEVRSELEWLCGLDQVKDLVNGGLREAENIRRLGEEKIEQTNYALLSLEAPNWFQSFAEGLQGGLNGLRPVKCEIKAWVTSRGEPLLYKIEDMYVYQEPETNTYEYVIGTRVLEPAAGLAIELP